MEFWQDRETDFKTLVEDLRLSIVETDRDLEFAGAAEHITNNYSEKSWKDRLTVFVKDYEAGDNQNPSFDGLGGKMFKKNGSTLLGVTEVGEGTLSLKGDENVIRDLADKKLSENEKPGF